jgi:hypothetical protein
MASRAGPIAGSMLVVPRFIIDMACGNLKAFGANGMMRRNVVKYVI